MLNIESQFRPELKNSWVVLNCLLYNSRETLASWLAKWRESQVISEPLQQTYVSSLALKASRLIKWTTANWKPPVTPKDDALSHTALSTAMGKKRFSALWDTEKQFQSQTKKKPQTLRSLIKKIQTLKSVQMLHEAKLYLWHSFSGTSKQGFLYYF